MLRVVGLLSASLLTQLVLVATQFILLPVQLANWGHAATADWYAGLAVAAIASISDAGFRTLGHDALIDASRDADDVAARERFLHCWLVVRALILTVTILLIAGNFLGSLVSQALPFSIWRMLLILSFAIETLIIVRIVYMDSLGLYNRAEFTYLAVVTVRLVAGATAVVLLDGGEIALAGVYLASSVIGLTFQEWSCRGIPLLRLGARPATLPAPRILAEGRFTIAEPMTNWTRLNLPVLVIVTIGNDYAVTTFVALRAIFGGLRNMLVQLARAGSVEFIRLARGPEPRIASDVLRAFLVTATWIAAGFGAAVLIDDYTLTRLWLHDLDVDTYLLFAQCMAVGALFYPYQLLVNVQMRLGKVAEIARRQYLWMLIVALFVAIALITGSLTLYATLLAAAEVLIGLLFYGARMDDLRRDAVRQGLIACIGCAALVIPIGLAIRDGMLPGLNRDPAIGLVVLASLVAVSAIAPALAIGALFRGRQAAA